MPSCSSSVLLRLAGLLITAVPIFAQSDLGSIEGVVRDFDTSGSRRDTALNRGYGESDVDGSERTAACGRADGTDVFIGGRERSLIEHVIAYEYGRGN